MFLETVRSVRGKGGRGRGSLLNRSIWEEVPISPNFSESFLAAQARQKQLDAQFANFTPNRNALYLNNGGDHIVRSETIDGRKMVVKELQRYSREYLVFGYNIDPKLVASNRDEALRIARTRQSAPLEEIAEKIRLLHTLEAAHMATHATVPTAIIVRDEAIYRIQREIPYIPASSDFEMKIQTQRAHIFYQRRKQEWNAVTQMQDFHRLPKDVRQYWKEFTPDHGNGGNAFFRGLGCTPEFDVVDL